MQEKDDRSHATVSFLPPSPSPPPCYDYDQTVVARCIASLHLSVTAPYRIVLFVVVFVVTGRWVGWMSGWMGNCYNNNHNNTAHTSVHLKWNGVG